MKNPSLLYTTLVMAALSLAAFYIAYLRGKHVEGLIITKNLLIQTLPLLLFAFLLAGLIQALIPAEVIAKWIGAESGIKGILIGSLAGA